MRSGYPTTCTPPAPLTGEQTAQLRLALLGLAADAMSGPGGLAAYLRTRTLGFPYTGKSLTLDAGKITGIITSLVVHTIVRPGKLLEANLGAVRL